jgi:hypothetical protein
VPRRAAKLSLRALAGSVAAAPAILLALGCGGITAPDLFVLTRTGAGPHAKLTLLVNEEGVVHCNGKLAGKLSDPQIVQARGITEKLEKPAAEHLRLAPRPGSVLHYDLRDANGTVSFADNSVGQPKVLRELVLLVLQSAQQVCRLPE